MAGRQPRASTYERQDGRYSVRWREHGRQREERGYTEDQAETRAFQITQRLRSGLPGIRERFPITDLIAAWWEGYVTAGSLSEATRTNYRTATRRVLESLGQADAQTISTPSLIAWAEDLDASLNPRLVNECLKVLSSAYQRGIEWGTVEPPNPVRSVPRRKEPPASVTIPTRAEATALGITAPTLRDRTRLVVAAYVGLRPGEQLGLEWRHIREGTIRVEQSVNLRGHVGPTKTGKPRSVPMPPSVEALLLEWANQTLHPKQRDPVFPSKRGTRLTPSPWRRDVWYPWRTRAEVEHLQWRTLRHYYASELAANGATIMQASRWMGHGTIRTTIDRYGFLFDEDAERVMLRLG